MAKVNIFYQELNYRTVEETPVYSVSQPGNQELWWGQDQPWSDPPGPGHGAALCTCSQPTDACRCPSCSQPWAASGACGLAPLSSLSWSCWSCCSMP